ncbi:hypothetical protein C7C46_02505 [Streptomyces tateyamensis]|uniref:Metallothionein n=1 Tax=Streptomyces tateyamensis TaxID=565073 RepID=A0A2V4NQC6_9ACTN|nr:hypothetical protein [Streptomyces tateyamensis]PYC87926.1 hypothetical protein C7C46_02505 [Streptomyces tateyamensis]
MNTTPRPVPTPAEPTACCAPAQQRVLLGACGCSAGCGCGCQSGAPCQCGGATGGCCGGH